MILENEELLSILFTWMFNEFLMILELVDSNSSLVDSNS